MKIGSLFSGYGGLDMGVQSVLGGEVVWHVEIEDAPSKVLAHHWDVPNYGDIRTVPWETVEPVDILTGGFPCQDVSLAGRRAGITDGSRSGLWSEFAHAIDVLRPKLVVIENVRGLLSATADGPVESDPWGVGDGATGSAVNAFGVVLGDLASLGYDARWGGFRASDAGAPHGRFRVFVVAFPAHADSARLGGIGWLDSVLRDADGRDRADRARDAGEPAAPADAAGERLGYSGTASVGRIPATAVAGDLPATPDAKGVPGSIGHRDDVRAGGFAVGQEPAAGRSAAQDTNIAAGGERRIAASGETEGRRSRADTCRRDRASAPDAERIGDERGGVRRVMDGTAGAGEGDRGERERDGDAAHDRGAASVEWGVYEPAVRRWEHALGRVAPAPTNADGKGGAHRLAPEFVEWMMGAPEGMSRHPVSASRAHSNSSCSATAS